MLKTVTRNEVSLWTSEKMVSNCKHHLHHCRLRYRTNGNLDGNVRLCWCFLSCLRCALNHHCLLGSHRSHIVGGLQEIRLDRWTFNGCNHRLTHRILGFSSRVVDMDSQLDSCNIFQCSCSELPSISECEFCEYPNLQVRNETKNVTKKSWKSCWSAISRFSLSGHRIARTLAQ